VAEVDAFIKRAVNGGAVLQRPIEHAHGSRSGWIIDPHGHRWNIGTPDRPSGPAVRRPAEPYYLTISSPDVERAAVFYGNVLDWQFADANEEARHITNTTMPMGVRPTHASWGDTTPGEVQLWFTVRDFDDAVDRVRVAGGTVIAISGYDSGREARCEDDQGVEFRLSEPAPGYDKP
jgi:predicted enzyme related to lactoylglutathione lyase